MPKILSDVGIDPAIASASPALDASFLAHSVITAGLLAFPGLLSLAADKASGPLESFITEMQGKWEKGTELAERETVLDLYETIMKSDRPLQEMLSDFDPDGDGMISCWECKQALGKLDIPESQCETLMGLMKRRFGDAETLAIESWLDYFQELYISARKGGSQPLEEKRTSQLQRLGNELPSKKTFVEIFNDLDKDGDGFISEKDFGGFLDKSNLRHPLTEQEKHEVFTKADILGNGRLNLFEFMSMMRKIVRVGIQEIGYGYLPLAWASLTAYWLGVGMKEFGLTLARLPDTFFIDSDFALPQIAASTEAIQATQTLLIVVALPLSIGLTQKLCNDNKIRGLRFSLHAMIQTVGAVVTLYLMLSSGPAMA
jgi:Ca2+-binding EF-hand superfamily protein